MDNIVSSIYTNASKHGDDVSKIVNFGDNEMVAIIADGVSTCTCGRVASSFMVYNIEKFLKERFKSSIGAEELEELAHSSIEYGANELVKFNYALEKIDWLLQSFYKKSNEAKQSCQKDLDNVLAELKTTEELFHEKNREKNEEDRAHAKIKEVLEDKRARGLLSSLFGTSNKKHLEKYVPPRNFKLDNEIAELRSKINHLQEEAGDLQRKLIDINYYNKNVTSYTLRKESMPKYLIEDNLYENIIKESEAVGNTLLTVIKETLNENESPKDVYQKIQNELLTAIAKGEKLVFKTNLCLAIFVKRTKRGKSEYRLNTFVLGDPEVRIISIKNKDNKEVYLKSSSAGLTSFISNDVPIGISGDVDFQSLSVKQDDFIILASDGANIKFNKSSTFPYTYFINSIANIDKSGRIAEFSKHWYQLLDKENAILDDFSLITIKVK